MVALNHSAVKVHVTHGGVHSLAESYVAGVPVLVIPHFADQPHNAAVAQYRGAGLYMTPKNLTPDSLRTAIRQLLYTDTYAESARRLGKRLLAAGGAARAASVIEDAGHKLVDGAIPMEYHMAVFERYHLDAYCVYVMAAGLVYWIIKRMEAKYFPDPAPAAKRAQPKTQKTD